MASLDQPINDALLDLGSQMAPRRESGGVGWILPEGHRAGRLLQAFLTGLVTECPSGMYATAFFPLRTRELAGSSRLAKMPERLCALAISV